MGILAVALILYLMLPTAAYAKLADSIIQAMAFVVLACLVVLLFIALGLLPWGGRFG